MLNIIREKSRTDPKGLWKILNNIDRKKSDVSNNVTLEQFVEYFKNLNELPISSDNSHNLSFRTEVNVLLRHATNVIIGLYELGSLVPPLFL
jgi:hypothetical protein